MKAYSLTQLLNVVPCDFDVKIIGNCGVDTAYVVRVDSRERNIAELKAEIAALRAYVAGVKGDAFPESEDK